jgi:hypothetical protein
LRRHHVGKTPTDCYGLVKFDGHAEAFTTISQRDRQPRTQRRPAWMVGGNGSQDAPEQVDRGGQMRGIGSAGARSVPGGGRADCPRARPLCGE